MLGNVCYIIMSYIWNIVLYTYLYYIHISISYTYMSNIHNNNSIDLCYLEMI